MFLSGIYAGFTRVLLCILVRDLCGVHKGTGSSSPDTGVYDLPDRFQSPETVRLQTPVYGADSSDAGAIQDALHRRFWGQVSPEQHPQPRSPGCILGFRV